eukprot:456415-Alexandrium_andersonii.AAC.1
MPWEAGGASRASYDYYGINQGFPRGLKEELKDVSDAALRTYRVDDVEYLIVPVISPNFKKEKRDSRVPAFE